MRNVHSPYDLTLFPQKLIAISCTGFSGKLKYISKQYKNETKFSNSIRYIWTKIIKIGLLHNGHLWYSKDWNVTPMTLLHKKKNIFIYLKELLHISTNITSLCIHKPIVQWLWFASNICNKISFVSPNTLL